MKTKSDCLIKLAVEAGYTADEQGNIYKPDKTLIKGGQGRSGHLNFIPNVVERKNRSSVLAHRFIMYFFYGDELFKHNVVRHLNDVPNDNRLSNLAFGSYKDNRADIPKEKLSFIAKQKASLLVERSRKLSDKDVVEMRSLRQQDNLSYAKLGDLFGVVTMTAYRAVNKQSWSSV
jgi:hypothetical protein